MSLGLKAGFLGSLGIHLLCFWSIAVWAPPSYEITVSPASIEISLVSSPASPRTLVQERPIQKEVISEALSQKSVKNSKDESRETPASFPQGVFRSVRPAERQNKAPVYPTAARRNGYEGTVVLEILVDAGGRVRDLQVQKTSGHSVLDQSAVRTVSGWLFEPELRFGIPVTSRVKIPITFKLEASR